MITWWQIITLVISIAVGVSSIWYTMYKITRDLRRDIKEDMKDMREDMNHRFKSLENKVDQILFYLIKEKD